MKLPSWFRSLGRKSGRDALAPVAIRTSCSPWYFRDAAKRGRVRCELFGLALQRVLPIAFALALFCRQDASAFPPAPHHLIFGMIRDEWGQPLTSIAGKVILETASGVKVEGAILPNLQPGVNYQLTVPMDGGLNLASFKPTALRPAMPFRMKVQIGTAVYVPIEMTGNFVNLGQPASQTRIDLTLGEDSDGDGLPDAWERLLISALGHGTLADIRPGDDSDHDGISNYDEYVAGTYAFDPADGFRVKLTKLSSGLPALEFLAIRNRTYSAYGSSDLTTWTPIKFRLPDGGPSAPILQDYHATELRPVQIVPVSPLVPGMRFFKMQVR